MRWPVPDAGRPFADYVRETREGLQRVHAGKPDSERIVAGNAPFELHPSGDFPRRQARPYRRGVLLTHGLSDSPYHMRHLADFFRRQGFRVMALLLPGHGTQPGDLLHVRWQDWAATVAGGVQCLAEEAEEVYLAGFSAGAALSVRHAAQDGRVRGLFLFSPALAIAARARWARLHRLYSWALPRAAWLHVLPDGDPFKYESFCLNAVAQMHALTHALPLDGVKVPVFIAASADDATVRAEATWRFMQQSQAAPRQLVWYATTEVGAPDVEWVQSALPERRILSSAHTAVVVPPQDAHYGEAGGYLNCLHYFDESSEHFAACMSSPSVWLGEVLPQYLGYGMLRRLMYNPHYAQMEAAMQRFIGELP